MKKKNRTLFLTFPLLVLVAILLFVVKQPIAQTDTPTELSNSDQVQEIIREVFSELESNRMFQTLATRTQILVSLKDWRLTLLAKSQTN